MDDKLQEGFLITEEYDSDSGPSITLPAGIYPFTLEKIERVESKTGSNMIKCHLRVKATGIGETTVYDNLVMIKSAGWKIGQITVCLGLRKKKEPVSFYPNMMTGKSGKAQFGVEEYTSKKGERRTRNTVVKYLEPTTAMPAAPTPQQPQEEELF